MAISIHRDLQTDPRAYAGQGAGGGKGNKSGSEWDAPIEGVDDLTPSDSATV